MRPETATQVDRRGESDPGGDGFHWKVGLFQQCPAASRRWASSHCPGLVPSCSVNRRARARLDRPARSASWPRVSGVSSREVAHSSSGANDSSALAGAGCAAYWSWLPSRCGGKTMRRAIWEAYADPWSERAR